MIKLTVEFLIDGEPLPDDRLQALVVDWGDKLRRVLEFNEQGDRDRGFVGGVEQTNLKEL